MYIMIVGCGKVGSVLAKVLDKRGEEVSVIDRSEEDFDGLPSDFGGLSTVGVPIDQDVLKKAGIENCDVLVAITKEDNMNIMVAQVATEMFHVPKVLTRIYDPQKREIFSKMGLTTVCPTNLTVANILAEISEDSDIHNVRLGKYAVSFEVMDIPKEYIGQTAGFIEFEENEVLYAVERRNSLILVGLKDIELMKGDKLIFSKFID